jgi:protein SCO1/2
MSARCTTALCVSLLFALTTAKLPQPAWGHQSGQSGGLRKIGPAPAFNLTTQDGSTLSLADLRGKVVVVNFIFTNCADSCPLLTSKLVTIQNHLGAKFEAAVFFVSITVDPEVDSPEVLRHYAEAMGTDPNGWAFLTGAPENVRRVARQYGVVEDKRSDGNVDHNLTTSIVDRDGVLRVQYIGERFDQSEFLHDLLDLVDEDKAP